MTRILFVGDIVGETGLAYLEACLPELIRVVGADFVVANAENLDLTPTSGGCGMTPPSLRRLFATGIDLVTGGNHSFDAPDQSVHDDVRVLRPLNSAPGAPGRGAGVIVKDGLRLGVINLASRTTLPHVDEPYPAMEAQLAAWAEGGAVDMVFIDFHSESVMEKMALAFAVAGRAVGVVGTHTHVPTCDTRILPGGTAYVSDVGMTGPGDGLQGYCEAQFIDAIRRGVHPGPPQRLAPGAIELGAVVITVENGGAVEIERISSRFLQ